MKSPLFAARLQKHVEKEQIIYFFSRFLASPTLQKFKPDTLYSGSLAEKNLRYNFLSTWALVEFLQQDFSFETTLRAKLISNAIFDALRFSINWNGHLDSHALSKTWDPVSFHLQFDQVVIFELPTNPDFPEEVLGDLIPAPPIHLAVPRISKSEDCEFYIVDDFLSDPLKFESEGEEIGLIRKGIRYV